MSEVGSYNFLINFSNSSIGEKISSPQQLVPLIGKEICESCKFQEPLKHCKFQLSREPCKFHPFPEPYEPPSSLQDGISKFR